MLWVEICSHGGQKPFLTRKEEEVQGNNVSVRGDGLSLSQTDFSPLHHHRYFPKLLMSSALMMGRITATQEEGIISTCVSSSQNQCFLFRISTLLPAQGIAHGRFSIPS